MAGARAGGHAGDVAVVQRTVLAVPAPFDLRLALRGHGWVALLPHRYDEADPHATWHTALRVGAQAVDVRARAGRGGLRVALTSHRRLAPRQIAEVRRQLGHMLRLGDDLTPFWSLCRQTPRLRWAARRGAGRLLRSPTVFEDLIKLLLTTNCTWSLTETMVRNLVQAAGPPTPGGACAFPSAVECDRGERFFRDEVRVGYRARACAALARAFARGELTDAAFLDAGLTADELGRRLLALDGFGPYAAGQAMRLLGHYRELALDSWCRARLQQLLGRRRPPADAAVARQYRPFGRWAGLALWCDLTAAWHGEGGAAPRPGGRGADGRWW